MKIRVVIKWTEEFIGAGKPAESDGGVLFKRIGQRKEELYELMTEAHEKHGGTGQDWKLFRHEKPGGTGQDWKLFRRLSAHVEPRPNDPTWVSNRSMRRNDDRLTAFGIWHCGCGLIVLQFWVLDKFRGTPQSL